MLEDTMHGYESHHARSSFMDFSSEQHLEDSPLQWRNTKLCVMVHFNFILYELTFPAHTCRAQIYMYNYSTFVGSYVSWYILILFCMNQHFQHIHAGLKFIRTTFHLTFSLHLGLNLKLVLKKVSLEINFHYCKFPPFLFKITKNLI